MALIGTAIAARVADFGFRISSSRILINRWVLAAILLVAVIMTPLIVIVAGVFTSSGSDTWHHLASTVLPRYIANTLILMAGTGALTLVMGLSTAWLVTAYEFRGRRVLQWALVLPLSIPTYIVAFAYAGLFDYTGRLRHALHLPAIDVMTIWGGMCVMAFVLYPYVYLITRASLIRQSRTVLEAAQLLGKTPFQTFAKIALPLSRPAIIAGVTLVLMEVLNDYGAVKYYGVDTFTTGIFRTWFSMGDAGAAIRLCGLLMMLVFVCMALERTQRGRAQYKNNCDTDAPTHPHKLSGWRAGVAAGICLLPILFGFIFPMLQLLEWALRTAGKAVSVDFLRLVIHSFTLATIASFLTVAVALVVVYATRIRSGPLMRSISKCAVLGYSIPGAVIAVGVMLPFAFLDNTIDSFFRAHLGISTGLILGGTLVALSFAYVVRFLAVAFGPIESGFERVCEHLDEASRSLGVSPTRTLWRINLPLIRGPLLCAALLVFVDVLKELPLTLILRPFNFDTLATWVFEFAGDERIAESAIGALVIVAVGILPITILNRLLARGKI